MTTTTTQHEIERAHAAYYALWLRHSEKIQSTEEIERMVKERYPALLAATPSENPMREQIKRRNDWLFPRSTR